MQYPEGMPGKWHEHFRNNNPILLELACGKGEYTTGLAELYPDKNIIGIDIKGNRIWVGAKLAMEKNLSNAAFLRTQIGKLDEYFSLGEVDEIWITFPDPQLRTSRAKKRLTHPRYLRIYKNILKENGRIHLKTDSPELYMFTKTVIDMYGLTLINDMDDVYASSQLDPELNIQTHYESLDIAMSKKIFYLSFTLPSSIEHKDEELHARIKDTEWKRTIEGFLFPGCDEEDFYYEDGFMVMSEKFHLKRGYCCGNGCRHCPYNYDRVPEPRRHKLLSLKHHGKK